MAIEGNVNERFQFTAVFHAPRQPGHPENMKMQYQAEQDKSPLTPLYERGVRQEALELPPFLKGEGIF